MLITCYGRKIAYIYLKHTFISLSIFQYIIYSDISTITKDLNSLKKNYKRKLEKNLRCEHMENIFYSLKWHAIYKLSPKKAPVLSNIPIKHQLSWVKWITINACYKWSPVTKVVSSLFCYLITRSVHKDNIIFCNSTLEWDISIFYLKYIYVHVHFWPLERNSEDDIWILEHLRIIIWLPNNIKISGFFKILISHIW